MDGWAERVAHIICQLRGCLKLAKIEKFRPFIVDMRAITSNDDRRFATHQDLNPSGI